MEAVSLLVLLGFYLGDVRFSGNYFFPDSILKRCFPSSRFDSLSLSSSIDCLLDMYEDTGFPYVRLRLGNFERHKDTVSFTIFIVEGKRERIERIEIEGNVRKDRIIEMLGIKSGEYFSGRRLKEGIDRLRNKELDLEEYGLRKGNNGVVVFLKVKEKRKSHLRGFLTYAMEEGFSGFIDVRAGGEFSRFGEIGGMLSKEKDSQRFSIFGNFPWRSFEFEYNLLSELPDTLTSFLIFNAKGGVKAGRFLFFVGFEGWEKGALGEEKEGGNGWIIGSKVNRRFTIETYKGDRYYRIEISFFLPFISGGYKRVRGNFPDFSLFRPGDRIKGFSPDEYSSSEGVWFSLHPNILFFVPLLEGAYMKEKGFIFDYGFSIKLGRLTLTYALPFGRGPMLGRVRVEIET